MNMRMQFCSSCQKYREPIPMMAGSDTVLVCNACDSAALYDHRDLWLEDRAKDVKDARECGESPKPIIGDDFTGHHFDEHYDDDGRKRSAPGVCTFCHLHVSMTPDELFPEHALEDDEELEDFL